ncbi:hypothetical protein [Enhygromyxa salina]|uniref:Uncharacterized protein n=1 Tax=Enhygromyxa salina TaxID=215803 RepID=A0A2S9Y3F6_9BACT|nr:hypothetical protein [Enhygromyxa salina]PRP99633.1 hypothetical protein ENSA7_62730 [Enhygromyxa salina]
MRPLSGLLMLVVGCHVDGPSPTEEPTPAVHAPEQPGAAPRSGEDPPADGCEPLPRAGATCQAEGSWCVIDWGDPCGASTAAWCRDGVWIYEEEANLCDD